MQVDRPVCLACLSVCLVCFLRPQAGLGEDARTSSFLLHFFSLHMLLSKSDLSLDAFEVTVQVTTSPK